MKKKALKALALLATAGFLGLMAEAPVSAGHPMLGVSVSNVYLADEDAEPHPTRCLMTIALTELPGYIPMVSTGGYDFCIYAEWMQFEDGAPAVDRGEVTVLVQWLNRRGRWRKLTRIADVPVEDNRAFACRRSFRDLEVGTMLRFRFDFRGLPPLDFFDGLTIEGVVLTGGASDMIDLGSGPMLGASALKGSD